MTTPIYLIIINSILIGAVSLIALSIMLYWNRATGGRMRRRRGQWRPIGGWAKHPSGRSLMGLLGIIFFITFNAAVQTLIPMPIYIRAPFYFSLYLLFGIALACIGLTIRKEIRGGRRHGKNLSESGDIPSISQIAKESSND